MRNAVICTLDMKIYPLADCGRDVVAGDAEVGAHVLPPHAVDLQRVPGPAGHQPVLPRRGSDPDLAAALPPPHYPGPRHACITYQVCSAPLFAASEVTVSSADQPGGVLVLPGHQVAAAVGVVDVGRLQHGEPGHLPRHRVCVDLCSAVQYRTQY